MQYCFQYISTCPVFPFFISRFGIIFRVRIVWIETKTIAIVMKRSQWSLLLLCDYGMSNRELNFNCVFQTCHHRHLNQPVNIIESYWKIYSSVLVFLEGDSKQTAAFKYQLMIRITWIYIYVSSKCIIPHWAKDHMGKNNFRLKIHGPRRYVLWVTGVT